MKIGTIVALSIALTFVFVINASVLGITSGLVGTLTSALDSVSGTGELASWSTEINGLLGGLMNGAQYAGKLAPLAVLVAVFGIDRMLRSAVE